MSDGSTKTLADDALTPPRPGDPTDEAATRNRVLGNMFGTQGETRIGRFIVRKTIGQGAMGRVYLADDPELSRAVALKLIAPTPDGRAEVRRLRLLREAQALAQVSHPNIVPIYEVGEHDGQVFIAMEFVDGADGRKFVATRQPDVKTLLDIYRQAGTGLAAAHARGLVHRDFKPDNILVGDDQRVRVVDFGLARPEGAPPSGRPNQLDSADLLKSPLTRTGAVLGTPAYLAPEVLAGGEADARADQFAFAVSLWEAITGSRPFNADSVPALYAAIERGPALSNKMPRRLHGVLARALALDPDARYPDMTALVDKLRTHGAGLGVWAGLGVAAALVSGTGIWMASQRSVVPDAQVAAPLADDRFRGEANEFVRAGDYARAETVLREGANAARKANAPALELAAYVALADLSAVHLADATKAELYLSQADALVTPAKPSPDLEAALQNAQARAATLAGDHQHAVTLHQAALGLLGQANVPAAGQATTQRALAIALAETGDHETAEAMARAAVAGLETSVGADNPETAAAKVDVARVLYLRGDIDGALSILEQSVVALAGSAHEADARRRIGAAEHALGHYDKAKAHYEAELKLRERDQGPHHPDLVATLRNLGLVHRLLGNNDTALSSFKRAQQLASTALGDTHPTLATVESSLGSYYHQQKDFDAAERHHRRALEIRAKRLGPDHPDTGRSHSNLGDTLSRAGRFGDAIPHLKSALAILESSLGPEHEHLGYPLTALGRAFLETGASAEALAPLERALKLRTEHEGHPLALATTQFHLARALAASDPMRAHKLAKDAHAAFASSQAYPEMTDKAAALARQTRGQPDRP